MTPGQNSLNRGQREAADGFSEFLFSDAKQMVLSGGGGVGKTFLMGYLIDRVMPQYFGTCAMLGIRPEFHEVVMCATTNQAAEVLAQATGRPTKTIHSFLNLTVTDDYSTGRSKLTKTPKWTVHTNKIIFIDECSMIDTPLYNVINEGTHNCKIVYVGDHCQLAPVTETISPIYRMDLPFYVLTEPMRNSGKPALIKACQQLRDTVETEEFQPIQIVPGVIDWFDDAQMETAIGTNFANQNRTDRILAYTNNRVVEFNDHIREIRQLPSDYITGEILVNNQAISLAKIMLSVEEEVEILAQHSRTERIIIERDPNSGQVDIEVRRSTLETSLGKVLTNVPLPVDRAHFAALLKHYKSQKNWKAFFALKNSVPDLRPRDAATIHKAQGSTYDTVFVDVGNLSTCHQKNVVARLLYVAFTRASNRVVLYGDLAQKYGGLTL